MSEAGLHQNPTLLKDVTPNSGAGDSDVISHLSPAKFVPALC